jgi:hypothetical protein
MKNLDAKTLRGFCCVAGSLQGDQIVKKIAQNVAQTIFANINA